MKKIIIALIIVVIGLVYSSSNQNNVGATWTPASVQVASSPVNGYLLQTNGTVSSWVAPATLGIGFSTTSTDYWYTLQDHFSTTSAIYFVNASTTIPKTYTNNVFTGLQSWSYSSSTVMSSFVLASTTNLTVSGHTFYPRWDDRMSIADATTTDSTQYKWGSFLESGAQSVTIDKIDTLIASTTFTGAQNTAGITWNLYIANTFGSSSPMKAFQADVNTNSTSSVQTFIPNGTTTIPVGYAYWLNFSSASGTTANIGRIDFNIYGHKN